MAAAYVNMQNLRFLLHEVYHVDDLFGHAYFSEYEPETISMMLDSAKELADSEFYPYFEALDRFGTRYESGRVEVHPQVLKVMQMMGENGWIGASLPYDDGGMQLPHLVANAAEFIFSAANNSLINYPALTAGAARLILTFGNKELKRIYPPQMLAGKWQGTMALTEPQAGSSLSDIVTSAAPTDEGYYRIRGTKIFISAGDYQGIENVVHLLLARIDGAPPGVKGISLFVVPKFRPTGDGRLEANDVHSAGVYHKMGQHGFSTLHLTLGESDNCRGYLVGEPHRGLSYMFQMMNAFRLGVGVNATGVSSAAYYASLQYAQERPQGRRLGERDLLQPQTLIINHPDVRRMLLAQKAIMEGSLSLVLECSLREDLKNISEGDEKTTSHLLAEILTPIAKAYPSEAGIRAVSYGLQVLGGYGYCQDFPLEQLYRDIRIMTLYEGTTGIQSLDLLGRKVVLENGRAFKLLIREMTRSIGEAGKHKPLKRYSQALKQQVDALVGVTRHLTGFARKGQIENFLADATVYLEMTAEVVVAWQWLKQGIAAVEKLAKGNLTAEEQVFYQSKLHTMKFFYLYELPRAEGFAKTLLAGENLTIPEETELIR